MARLKTFDTSAFLDDDEVVAEYLTAALGDSNPDVFLAAIGQTAKAGGMSAIAKSTGLGGEILYKALAPGAKPCCETILKVLRGLGARLAATGTQDRAGPDTPTPKRTYDGIAASRKGRRRPPGSTA